MRIMSETYVITKMKKKTSKIVNLIFLSFKYPNLVSTFKAHRIDLHIHYFDLYGQNGFLKIQNSHPKYKIEDDQ